MSDLSTAINRTAKTLGVPVTTNPPVAALSLINGINGALGARVDKGGRVIGITGDRTRTISENFGAYDTTDQVTNASPAGAAGGVATGTTNVLNHCYTPGGFVYAYFNIGTQTILGPALVAAGLDIGCDLTDNDGLEILTHFNGASGRPFIIGNDAGFFFRATVNIADVSGCDDFHVGFRRAEPAVVGFDNYNDLASIGVVGTAGAMTIETILNNGATTTTATTDTAWADGVTKILQVNVSAAGVVTYTINGAAPTATAAFTFDNGDPVIPFIHFLQGTTSPGAVVIEKWEVGYI